MLLPKALPRLLLATALTTFCLSAPAFAETVTVTGIEIGIGTSMSFTIPTVEVEDSSLDEAAIRALFTNSAAATTAQWSELDATRIFIPEVRFSVEMPGRTDTVYRDIELVDVVDGVAASGSIGSSETSEQGMSATFGRVSAGRIDFGAMTDLYMLRSRPGDTLVRQVYASLVVDGGRLTAPDVNCEFGGVRVAEFSARPLQTSFEEILPLLEQLAADPQAESGFDPEAITKAVHFYIDMLTAFRSAPIESDGFTCSGKNNDGKPLEIKSGPIAVDGFEPGIYPSIAVNDFRLDVEGDGWMEFGNITLKPMDFTGAIAALEAAQTLDEAWFTANWRKLVPALDGLSLAGFSMDVPDPETSGQRIQAAIGAFDVSLGDYVNGIPAQIGLSASDIQVPLPPDQPELASLGYDRLDLDYDIALHWDEAASNIVVDRFVVTDAALGSVMVSGTLGNATADLFSDDPVKVAAASAGLTLKGLEIEVADAGMTTLLVALAAKEQNQRPVVFRAMLSGLAQALPVATLGPTPEARALGSELRAFFEGKPNLKVTLTAKDPAGIGLADFEAAQRDPSVLGGKIAIVAEASGEPRPLVDEPAPAPEPEPEAEVVEDVPAEDANAAAVDKLGGKQAPPAM